MSTYVLQVKAQVVGQVMEREMTGRGDLRREEEI